MIAVAEHAADAKIPSDWHYCPRSLPPVALWVTVGDMPSQAKPTELNSPPSCMQTGECTKHTPAQVQTKQLHVSCCGCRGNW